MACYFHITIRHSFIQNKIGGNNILFLYRRELYPISIRNQEHLIISALRIELSCLKCTTVLQHIVMQQAECD
jgi:hypothetical protein